MMDNADQNLPARQNAEPVQDELDEADVAAIEEGLAQLERGESRAWEEVKEELRTKYLSR